MTWTLWSGGGVGKPYPETGRAQRKPVLTGLGDRMSRPNPACSRGGVPTLRCGSGDDAHTPCAESPDRQLDLGATWGRGKTPAPTTGSGSRGEG